jgi:ribosome maturation factor RimP
MAEEALQAEVETRIESLGFELVDLEQVGSKARPILRIRIDRPNAETGVTLEDCARVSRELESFLDDNPQLGERYVLEVSSPGVERPLVKPRDYERFAGKEIAIKTSEAIGDLGKRVEGVLRGIKEGDVVELDVKGQTIEVERGNIKKANLVYRWDEKKKK